MNNVLRLAIVDPNDITRDTMKSTLLGLDTVWLEAECSRYDFFLDVVKQTNPDVTLVALDSNPEKGIELIEKLTQNFPEVSCLVASSSTDGQLILQTMRAGAKEFLTLPLKGEELVNALQRLAKLRFGSEGTTQGCNVISIAGATGGVGSTSVAVNLGCALATNPNNSVVLVDIDLALGDADVFLDTIPDYTLSDVTQNISRLDFGLLKRSLTKHSSGLYLLPRPIQLEDTHHVTPDNLKRLLGLLKTTFTHLIIDLSKSYTELDMCALEESDTILLTTQLDLPCLRNVVRLMMSFKEQEQIKDKISVVINRAGDSASQISLKKAEETLDCEVSWQIPNDYKTMIEVRNNGIPLIQQAPKAPITQSFIQYAEKLCGTQGTSNEPEAPPKKTGWLNRWSSRSSSSQTTKEE